MDVTAELKNVQFANPVSTPDWGAAKARATVVSADAKIKLDLDLRLVVLEPRKGGTTIIVPLENVTQWILLPPETPPEPVKRGPGRPRLNS